MKSTFFKWIAIGLILVAAPLAGAAFSVGSGRAA